MEIILSEKGKKQILLNGFCYRLDRILVNGKESWRCTDVNCKGRIHVYEDTWEIKAKHSHVPHPAEGAKKAMQSKLRQKASSSNDTPRLLIQESSLNLADEAVAILPKYSSLQRTVQRHRRQHENVIPAPSNVSEIKIPDWLAKTHTGQNFLMFDSGSEDPNRIFIFSTPKNIEHLVENKHWMADGTFKIAPQLFYQLHVIHITRNGNVFPMVYVLLQNKVQQSYERVLQELKNLNPNIIPESILCDFEKAFHNAIKAVFPTTQIVGCLFHLSQCVWRKVQNLKLVELYLKNENIRTFCRMLVALAFVPVDQIETTFETLQDEMPSSLDELFAYFEDTWIGRPFRRGRRDPVFKPSIWSIYDRVQTDLPKNNNALEGWHRATQMSLGHFHPTIYKFIDFLRLEQDHMEKNLLRFAVGQVDKKKNSKYGRVYEAIKTVVFRFNEIDNKMDYLKAISYHLSLQK